MNIFTLSFVITSGIVAVFLLLTTLTGANVVDHWMWIGIAAKAYYLVCFLIGWYATYKAIKSHVDWVSMVKQWDLEDEEWRRKNLR